MKIYTQGYNPETIGGGHSFLTYFRKGDWRLTDNPENCDIYFITSVSMLDKVSQIPFGDKKVVLRVDNALLDSRNGRIYPLEGNEKITRMEALKQVAQNADAVVYQSNWSLKYISPFVGDCKGKQTVIINGSDDELFNGKLGKLPRDKSRKLYLYVRSSNHDNKGWHVAKYYYEMLQRNRKNAALWIIGRFSPENGEHNFDFWNGENYQYLGYVNDKETMALYMRSADYLLYPYFCDSCSQTLIESYLSGLKIKWLAGSNTGGSYEIRNAINKYGREYLSYKRMNKEYKELFKEIL